MSLFLCMVWGCVLTSLIYLQLCNFPSTTCWRDCLFSIVYSCPLCWRLTVGVWVFFWALCSIPLIHMFVFVPIPCCFDICSFVVLSEIWEGYAPALFFFLRLALAVLGVLWFHINFWIICSSPVNVMGNLIGITLNL